MPQAPQDADEVTRAADEAIMERARQMGQTQVTPTSIAMATMDDLTRIRFELTALRRLLDKAIAKM
jgi:hypothetical protein